MPVILTRADVDALVTPADALEAAKRAFTALERNEVTMPERLATRVEDHHGTHLSMPCYVRSEGREVLSTKIATVFENNPERGIPTTLAFLTLQNPQTGELLALMDAERLTALRTAAASALAVDLMAPRDADTMTLFGVGGQAAAHLEAIAAVRSIRKVFVIARSMERAREFCERQPYAELLPTEDREMGVRSSCIICTTTNSTEPVFDGSALQANSVITAIGAFRPDMREVDPTAVERSFVVVDQKAAAQRGAGDLIQAGVDWERVTTLGQVFLNPTPRPEGKPVLFKSVGLAVQDAFIAATAYDRARQAGLGQHFELD